MDDLFHLRLSLDGLGRRLNVALTEHVNTIESQITTAVEQLCTPEHFEKLVMEQATEAVRQEVMRKIRTMVSNDRCQHVIDDAVDEVMARIFEEERSS